MEMEGMKWRKGRENTTSGCRTGGGERWRRDGYRRRREVVQKDEEEEGKEKGKGQPLHTCRECRGKEKWEIMEADKCEDRRNLAEEEYCGLI